MKRAGTYTKQSSRWGLALLLLLFLVSPSRAAVDEVKADVSSRTVEVGNTFLYQVTVSGSGNLPTPTVNLPSSFQIVSGPNSNISMQFINGKMSSTRTLTYRLRAMRKGDYTITGPTVTSKGKQITGTSITIEVASNGAAGSTQQSSPGTSSPSTRQQTTPPPASRRAQTLPSMFLEATVSSQSVSFQEPLTLIFTLYYQEDVKTFNVNRLASTEGFWSEQWPVPERPDIRQEYVNGQLYNAADLHRLILFPTKTGELKIGEMDVTIGYRKARRNQRQSLFDSFFSDPFSSSIQYEDLKSDPITIKVAPLPTEGRPANFENVVGDYRIRSSLDTDQVRTNESVTFTVTISGEGNIGFIPTPDISFPSDLEVYEPQVEESHQPSNGVITGSKSFTWLLIPRRPGKQTIPAVSFSYFDPKTKQYRTPKAPAHTLQVQPATGWSGVDTESSDTPSEVETLGTDIRWILQADHGLRRHGPPLQERPLYWLAYLIPVGVAAAGFGLRKRQDKLLSQTGLVRSRKAAKRALEALSAARSLLSKGEIQEGYTGLARGLIGYISDRIGIPVGQLDRQRLLTELGQRNVSESAVRELVAVLDLCDSARFTPQGAEANSLAELIERAQRWIGQVDRSLALERS
ncbi:BatD family protein [bacterium]|nr:BatD family protein [bacterium]